HLLSALLSGFPLGAMHILIAAEMAILVWVFGVIYKNKNKKLAGVVFIIGNAFIAPLPFIYLISSSFYFAILPALFVGSV
ncbi:hypothetical protein Q8G50_34070, partial [Klebsiella pneumoniae]